MALHRVIMLLIVVLAATGPGGAMAAPSDDEPVSSPPISPGTPLATSTPSAQPRLPSEIAAVHPRAGSRVCARPEIRVDLRLTDPMRPGGTFDPSRVSLRLDGRTITPEVRAIGTLTYPQARAYLVYQPATALSLGEHHAEIDYPSVEGPKTFRWSFVVAATPCQ